MSHLDEKRVTLIVKTASEMCFSDITFECVQLQEKSLLLFSLSNVIHSLR